MEHIVYEEEGKGQGCEIKSFKFAAISFYLFHR